LFLRRGRRAAEQEGAGAEQAQCQDGEEARFHNGSSVGNGAGGAAPARPLLDPQRRRIIRAARRRSQEVYAKGMPELRAWLIAGTTLWAEWTGASLDKQALAGQHYRK
jgi:hypothetical protein